MADLCRICAGPIDPPHTYEYYAACLGPAHANAAFLDSTCVHCANLPVRTENQEGFLLILLRGRGPLPPGSLSPTQKRR